MDTNALYRWEHNRYDEVNKNVDYWKFQQELSSIGKTQGMLSLPRKRGFVYLIKGDENITKIGITLGDPFRRLKELGTGSWLKYKLEYIYPAPWPTMLEKALHRCFSHFRIKNEWFSLSSREIRDFTWARDSWNGINWWAVCEETCSHFKIGSYNKDEVK